MPLTPDEFYAHALDAADSEQRLPLSRMTGWQISPFEEAGLRVSVLRPPVIPEPPRKNLPLPFVCGRNGRKRTTDWPPPNTTSTSCPKLSKNFGPAPISIRLMPAPDVYWRGLISNRTIRPVRRRSCIR